MLEGFSERARRVVTVAEEEAHRLGHSHLGTEHLLLGVLVDGTTAASRVLVAAGATADGARRKVLEAVPAGDAAAGGGLSLTARAQRALDRAGRFARQRHDPEVSTGHVLLGILDVEGTAGQVLRGLGVDVPALPAALEATARGRGGAAPAAAVAPSTAVEEPAVAPDPCCSGCGAELAGVLAYRTIAAAGPDGQRRFIVVFCGACGSVVGTTV